MLPVAFKCILPCAVNVRGNNLVVPVCIDAENFEMNFAPILPNPINERCDSDRAPADIVIVAILSML